MACPPLPVALACTGVGSSHHRDPEAAVTDALRRYPDLPHWPQLPNRAPEESMVAQFGLLLPGARWDGALLHCDAETVIEARIGSGLPPPHAAAGLHAFLARLEATAPPRRPAMGKGQITGPLTIALHARDHTGTPLWRSPAALEALGGLLGRAGAAQAQALQRLGIAALIVVDEPVLSFVGREPLPIAWPDAIAALRAALAPIQGAGALAGVHCCQPAEWTRVLESGPDLLHLDARPETIAQIGEHHTALQAHLGRGGAIGWGIWPTHQAALPFDPDAAQRFLFETAEDLTSAEIDLPAIFHRSILSGSCGTAGLTAEEEERLARDLAAVAANLRGRLR